MAQAVIRIDKQWGYETVLVNEPEYCAKFLHIEPGKRCSLHFHSVKKETFFVQSGLVTLEREGFPDELLKFGEQRTILPGVRHRFSSVRGATILEISTHHDDADVIRLEPSGELPVREVQSPALSLSRAVGRPAYGVGIFLRKPGGEATDSEMESPT